METTAVEVAENKYVHINPDAYDALIELMDHEKDYPTVLMGENANGESTIIDIESDFIEVETHQSNGWIRRNVYWRDMAVEELYDGRWQ